MVLFVCLPRWRYNPVFMSWLLNVQDPFLNIAPKKPNWDLRRDVQKKLDKLEKRTQKAMFQLMGMLFGSFVLIFIIGFSQCSIDSLDICNCHCVHAYSTCCLLAYF